MSITNAYHSNITVSEFDEVVLEDGFAPLTKIMKYTLSNGTMEVDIIDYGATITAIRVPDKDGNMADIVLGFDNMKGYMATKNNPYFGSTIGRVANRIANGKFVLDNLTYVLSKNEGDKTLHGGIVGFNRKLWHACIDAEGLLFNLTSPHLDQGFPGEMKAKARFILTRGNELVIRYKATTDRTTIINMTNHSYFNLAGHDSGAEKLYEHDLMINAMNFTPNDENNIPQGKIQDVLDTVLDFTTMKNVGESILNTGDANGFDINFIINDQCERRLVACLEHPGTGRRMVIHSNQPGVQLYTGNCVEVKEGEGKQGVGYSRHAALCLETQNFPNAINEKHFPSCILTPQQTYVHVVSYQFSIYDPEERSVNKASRSSTSKSSQSDIDIDAPTEDAAPSEKSEMAETKVKPDAPECVNTNVFPDFRTSLKLCNDPFQYEPLSSIFPSELEISMKSSFDSELKQCQTLLNLRNPNCGKIRNNIYNVLANTDITPSRNEL